MGWNCVITKSYGVLTESAKKQNVEMFYQYFCNYMTIEAMAGILGNIERESLLNPGQIEGDSDYNIGWDNIRRGHGFIQWTGESKDTNPLLDWKDGRNNNKWADGDFQCYRIKCEGEEIEGAGGCFYPSDEHPEYKYTWEQFCKLTDPIEAMYAYLFQRERAGVGAENERKENTEKWYKYLLTLSQPFEARVDTNEEIYAKKYWISSRSTAKGDINSKGYNRCLARNEFSDSEMLEQKYRELYMSNSVLPNCTGYAWGRAHEIMGESNLPKLSIDNAGTWFSYTSDGYERSTSVKGEQAVPKLGAIACWDNPGKAGHVAVVEKINYNADNTISSLTLSESAYGGFKDPYKNYHRIETEDISLFKIGATRWGVYKFQGFIYLPGVGGASSTSLLKLSRPHILQIAETEIIGNCIVSNRLSNNYDDYKSNLGCFCINLDLPGSDYQEVPLSDISITDDGIFNFKIPDLIPDTSYSIYLTLKDGSENIKSETTNFRTMQSLPKAVTNIQLKAAETPNITLPNSLFSFSYDFLKDWGYWETRDSKKLCYLIYLIVDGEILAQFETSQSRKNFEKVNLNTQFRLQEPLTVGKTVQIGVQPVLQLKSNSKYLYGPINCSNAICLKKEDYKAYLKNY